MHVSINYIMLTACLTISQSLIYMSYTCANFLKGMQGLSSQWSVSTFDFLLSVYMILLYYIIAWTTSVLTYLSYKHVKMDHVFTVELDSPNCFWKINENLRIRKYMNMH